MLAAAGGIRSPRQGCSQSGRGCRPPTRLPPALSLTMGAPDMIGPAAEAAGRWGCSALLGLTTSTSSDPANELGRAVSAPPPFWEPARAPRPARSAKKSAPLLMAAPALLPGSSGAGDRSQGAIGSAEWPGERAHRKSHSCHAQRPHAGPEPLPGAPPTREECQDRAPPSAAGPALASPALHGASARPARPCTPLEPLLAPATVGRIHIGTQTWSSAL